MCLFGQDDYTRIGRLAFSMTYLARELQRPERVSFATGKTRCYLEAFLFEIECALAAYHMMKDSRVIGAWYRRGMYIQKASPAFRDFLGTARELNLVRDGSKQEFLTLSRELRCGVRCLLDDRALNSEVRNLLESFVEHWSRRFSGQFATATY